MIPAFPRPFSVTPVGLENNQQVLWDQQGMTLLDYFAGQMVESVMKQFPLLTQFGQDDKEETIKELKIIRRRRIAMEAYDLAEAFLKIREERDKDEKRA